MLSFANPWAFWLLVLPFLVWKFVPVARQHKPAVRVPFFDRVKGSADEADGAVLKRHHLSWVGRSVLWVLLIVALARPMWVEDPIERAVPTRDLLLVGWILGTIAAPGRRKKVKAPVSKSDPPPQSFLESIPPKEPDSFASDPNRVPRSALPTTRSESRPSMRASDPAPGHAVAR